MTTIDKVLFTGKTHTTASHRNRASHGGAFDLRLSSPGGAPGGLGDALTAVAPHPTAEQLFAGAWSACYIAALGLVAQQRKLKLPADLSVDIEVDLGLAGDAYLLQARLGVRMPGVEREVAEAIAHAADAICPYSKATKGNIDVRLNVLTS